ncbi:MAG: autotransporter-associated beta strand repeat-containing protein, partial [Chthoniobacteraceae bacterium]
MRSKTSTTPLETSRKSLLVSAALAGRSYHSTWQRLRLPAGLICTAAAGLFVPQKAEAASLVHRYEFADGTDTVGAVNGSLVGNITLQGGQLLSFGSAGAGRGGANPTGFDITGSNAGLTGDFSIEQYYTRTNDTGNFQTLFDFGNGTATDTYVILTPERGTDTDILSVATKNPTGGEIQSTATSATAGDGQQHVVFTYEAASTTLRLYIDGALTDTATIADGIDLSSFTNASVNGLANFNDPSMAGLTNDFRIYTGVLDQNQVTALNAIGANASTAQVQAAASLAGAPVLRTWSGTVNGNWDTTTANFSGATFANGDAVLFGDTGVTTRNVIAQAAGVTPGTMSVDNSTADYTFTGPIRTTLLTKDGTSAVTIGGAGDAADNTGLSARVNTGTLILAKDSSASVHAVNHLVLASGATVRLEGTGGDQIGNNDLPTISGTLELNGRNEGVYGLAGTFDGVVTNNGAAPSTLTVGLNDGTGTFDGLIDDGTSTVAIIKTGSGTQVFSQFSNTYSGGTTVNGGVLRGSTDLSFGTGPIAINSGGTADFVNAAVISNVITLGGGTLSSSGAALASVDSPSPLSITAASSINVGSGGELAISSPVTGTAGLTKTGPGTLVVSLDNTATFTGPLTISRGTVR